MLQTASTDLHAVGLGFVSWLLCFMLFCLCGGLWFCIAKAWTDDDEDAEMVCGGGWLALGVLASILCIVLSHIGDRINYMEAAEPAMHAVDPRSTGPGLSGLGMQSTETWQQDRIREFEFDDSFIDLSLGTAHVMDISRSCGDDCSCTPPPLNQTLNQVEMVSVTSR